MRTSPLPIFFLSRKQSNTMLEQGADLAPGPTIQPGRWAKKSYPPGKMRSTCGGTPRLSSDKGSLVINQIPKGDEKIWDLGFLQKLCQMRQISEPHADLEMVCDPDHNQSFHSRRKVANPERSDFARSPIP